MPQKRELTAREKHALRQRRRRWARIRFFSTSAVCILLLAGVITTVIELPAKRAAAQSLVAEQEKQEAEAEKTAQEQGNAGLGVFGPVQKTELNYNAPSTAALALPENGRVDMSYFQDALFIGDSLTQGMQVYASGISNAKYAAYVGIGPRQLMSGTVTNLQGQTVTAMDEILAANAKKVYILLGTNTLSSLTDEAFLKYYGDFLDYLAPQMAPDAEYYLQAIPPVVASKSESDVNYANSRIVSLNESIAQMAYERGWHYLDLYSALADENGNLRGEIVTGKDGVHLNGVGYQMWTDFLVTHTAYSADSPYIAGSPFAPVA